jgi:hypothetical protein
MKKRIQFFAGRRADGSSQQKTLNHRTDPFLELTPFLLTLLMR